MKTRPRFPWRRHPYLLTFVPAAVSVAVAAGCGNAASTGESTTSSGGGGTSSASGATLTSSTSAGTAHASATLGSNTASTSSGAASEMTATGSTGSATGSSTALATGSSTTHGSTSSTGGSSAASSSATSSSSSLSSSATALPGDVAAAASTPVVAAHAMTRALFASYAGKLFQVTRMSDGQTSDISAASPGGPVDLTALNTFCSGATCGVSILYDQTGNGNDLTQTTKQHMPTVATWTTKGGSSLPYALTQNSGGAGAIGGDPGGQYLRKRTNTTMIPKGSSPQTEYMVVYAKYYKGHCCYDYGNMETQIRNDGPGTMNALYFGQTKDWTFGAGNGPWGMVDMEDGVFSFGAPAGVDPANGNPDGQNSKDPAFVYPTTNVVAVLSKTNGTSTFVLKVGDMEATSGFTTAWSGVLPSGYASLNQEGGLSLGEGGDGSDNVDGAFFEGVVIAGEASDATDSAIETNLHATFTQ